VARFLLHRYAVTTIVRMTRVRTTTITALLLAALAGACPSDETTPALEAPPSAGKADNLTAPCQGPGAAMEYVKVCGPDKVGGTACKCISRLVMGTDHLGNFWEQWGFPEGNNNTPAWKRKVDAQKMLDYAVDKGINLFDTAPIYADGIENTLGAWMQQRKQQNPGLELYTLTKGGFPFDLGPGTYDSRLHGSRKEIIKNISEELQWSYPNLHGQIDFYLMHRDDIRFVDYVDRTYGDENGVPRAQTAAKLILEALSDDAVHGDIPHLKGKSIRSHYTWVGVSNWTTARVGEALQAAKNDPSLLPPVINSPYFSLFEMSGTYTIHSGGVEVTHAEMMNPAFQKGVLIMPYSPLGGFPIIDKGTAANQGKDAWDNARKVAKGLDNNQDRYWGNVYEALFTPENEQRFHRVYAISQTFTLEGVKYSIDQWLNAYVLAHPRTDLLAVGPIKKEHIDRTAAALELARALRKRPDILDWLYDGKLADLSALPPLAEPKERTAVLIYGETQPGQDMYIRGGIDHGYAQSAFGKSCTAQNKLCAVPIRHLSVVKNTEIVNDHYLDWYGPEPGQGSAEGSPAMWTTNKWPESWGPKKTVENDGYGETSLNTYGHHYWLLDVMMDCSRTANGWFELKTYISNGPGWEGDIKQPGAPQSSRNHLARCGKINVFRRDQDAPVEIKDWPPGQP
jgi:aryl-alcohol dehydrogenase-like predicted oxidoreductase